MELTNSVSSQDLNSGLQNFEKRVFESGAANSAHRNCYVSATHATIKRTTCIPNLSVHSYVAGTPGLKINLLPEVRDLRSPEFVQSILNAVQAHADGPVQNLASERMEIQPITSGLKRPRVETSFVWVKYGGAVFKVLPAAGDVDSLKDAVKVKAQLSHPSFQLNVKDHKGNVLEVDAPLEANTQ